MRTVHKFGVILLILAALLAAGCAESTDDIEPETAITEPTNASEEAPAVEENVTIDEPVIEGESELKIMSVTAIDNTLDIKVKNVGNATAKDVYCGLVIIDDDPNYSILEREAYDGYFETLREIAYQSNINGSYYVDTGYYIQYGNTRLGNLTLLGVRVQTNYVGDLAPGELQSSQIGAPYGYDEYISIAWIDGEEENFVMHLY